MTSHENTQWGSVMTLVCTMETPYKNIIGTDKILFVISDISVNKHYKTKEIDSLGQEKFVCYIMYFVI